MRWFSLKGLLVLFSMWHASHQMKDLLESIHPSVENNFELNSFLQDVVKLKRAFREIRNAAADLEDNEDSWIDDHMNDDIDEYVYDAENLEAERRKLNGGKHHESSNKASHYHKENRPSNDIYPHIYKGHAGLDHKHLEHDNGIRYRRQLVEDVQIEPKSSNGNIKVPGERFNILKNGVQQESTQYDPRETLMAIFTEFLKSTLPYQDESSMPTDRTPVRTENPLSESTLSNPENIILVTSSQLKQLPQSDNSITTNPIDKKKNYNIKIMEDGKIVREYTPTENLDKHLSEMDSSTESSTPLVTGSSSVLDNEFKTKLENKKYEQNDEDATRPSMDNFQKIETINFPSEKPKSLNPIEVKENPILIGRKVDGIKDFYRLNRQENNRHHSYNGLDYLQQIYPRYSYLPNRNVYGDDYKSSYNLKFKPQITMFKTDDDDKDTADYPMSNQFYQLRRLKSTNESSQESTRKKRNIQELLGINNEDDYLEDFDFSTESSTTDRASEDEENYSSMKTDQKSTDTNLENFSKSSTKSSADYSSKVSTVITTASSDLSAKHDFKAITHQTESVRIKRAKKYRNLKKRRKINHIRKNMNYESNTSGNIKSKRNCDQKDTHKLKTWTKKSNQIYKEENRDYMLPSEVVNGGDYNVYSKSFRNPRFERKTAAAGDAEEKVHQSPTSNGEYIVPTYFHFVPFGTPGHFYHMHRCIHYNPRKVVNENADRTNKLSSSSSKLGKQSSNTFRGRKLMSNSEISQKEHKRDIVTDIINGGKTNEPKESMTKRTESDYGEEPDLSEGQTIKKHSKLKKYNKVEAPGKNFDDNYEFEESPNENRNPHEPIEDQVGKNIKKNSEWDVEDRYPYSHSIKEKITQFKNKLLNKEDELDEPIQDTRSQNRRLDNNKRIERQPAKDGSVPFINENEELSNTRAGLTSNSNFEPMQISDPHFCPDELSSQGPYVNPSAYATRNSRYATCRWHFNPLSGTFEAIPCPCDPCEPSPCPTPCEPPPPPCPCPTTCNPCPTVTESYNDAFTVKERSSILSDDAPCASTCNPCPEPDLCCEEICPCPPPPCPCDPSSCDPSSCETCPCPGPCPSPCPCPYPCPCPCDDYLSKGKDGLNENEWNSDIKNPFDKHFGSNEATDSENYETKFDNNVPLSGAPFPGAFSEEYRANFPHIQFRQYPRQCMFLPNNVYKMYNVPASLKLGEAQNENYFSSYEDISNENMNKCPYPKNNLVYPYSSDPNYRQFLEKLSIHDDGSNVNTRKFGQTNVHSYIFPHYCPCPRTPPNYYPYLIPHVCPYPHSVRVVKEIYPSIEKRDVGLDVEKPERSFSSSNICPCVFGYFLPCLHLNPSFNQHPHFDHSEHHLNDADEIHDGSDNGERYNEPEAFSVSREGLSRPLSFSTKDTSRFKNSYSACRPAPLGRIFSSQPDSINLQQGSLDNPNVEDNYEDSVNDIENNYKRTPSERFHSNLPRSFDNTYPRYFELFQEHNNAHEALNHPPYQKHLFAEANPDLFHYQGFRNPSQGNPISMVENDLKQKRRCPKPAEPFPPCTGCPPFNSKQQADITNDMLAEKARRVNEYLKSKFLTGQYSMNNMMLPRSKRQLISPDNLPSSMSDNTSPVIRKARRPHGLPRKPLNRKMPEQFDDKKEKTKHARSDEEDTQAESSLPYSNIEDDQDQEEESDQRIHLDRKSRSFLNEENNQNQIKAERCKNAKKKNRVELQDLHFAKEIIDSVIEKVNKNPNLKIKIGNALNKKKIYEAETNQQNHAKECSSKEQEDYEETRNLLRSVSCVLNKLVKKQIQEKLCERLPNHLKSFLRHIVKPPKHIINRRSNDKYHEDTFLFRAGYPEKKLNERCRNRLENKLMDLLSHYDHLDGESRKKAAPVQNYIINHLNMLKKIEEEHSNRKDSLTGQENILSENEHPLLNCLNEEKIVAHENPVKFERCHSNMDIMQRDVENSDLEQEQNALEKVGLHGPGPTKNEEEDLGNKLKKRETINDNYKLHAEEKRIAENSENEKNKVSDKYKKLVEAAEEVRCKRKNEEKIGEAFGKKEVKRNIESSDLQHIIR